VSVMRSAFTRTITGRLSFVCAVFMFSGTAHQLLGQVADAARSGNPPDTGFRVVLLGTGTPNPRPDRFGPSTLVEAGSERLLFDCGRSCTTRLWQRGIPLGTVKLFITHLHSDHTVGIPDLWLTGFLSNPYGRRTTPLRVWGPSGTAAMMTHLRQAYDADIRIRKPEGNVDVDATDFTEGLIYDANEVRVTAFKVSHDDIDAYGFRIDYRGHSVVLSGDTRPSPNLVAHARGVDVIVHEVAMSASDAGRRVIANLHSTPEQAGEEFTRIGAKLAVYSHFSLFGVPEPTMEELIARTRTTYRGPLEVGEDLMIISIGDSVTVQRLRSPRS
jgi:ribonuclease Z